MNKLLVALMVCLPTALVAAQEQAQPTYYGPGLCSNPQFECVKTTPGQTWVKMFPNDLQREIVQKINRSYNYLWAGKQIAVPRNLANATLLDVAPFPQQISEHEKQIIVDQEKLAWGAYDAEGQLINWGPISSGRDKCSDSNKSCRTMTGIFRVFSKENEHCKSDVYPLKKGGAPMPFCMYFHKGFALHGADDVPGYRASHGCVRLFVSDAKWLNENFVDIASDKNEFMGTKVVVRPLNTVEKLQ